MTATTKVRTNAGRFRITTVSEDGMRLYLDGQKLRDRWSSSVAFWDHFDLDLAEGEHTLRIDYFHSDGKARVGFFMDPLPPKPVARSPGSAPAPDTAPAEKSAQ